MCRLFSFPIMRRRATADGEGAWFWWASAGAEVYKQLWDMLYTELTETYGLHNLIWTYNSYVYPTSPAWYPGDDQVISSAMINTIRSTTAMTVCRACPMRMR